MIELCNFNQIIQFWLQIHFENNIRRKFKMNGFVILLVVLILTFSTESMGWTTCQYTKNELLSMKVDQAFKILLDFYEDNCPSNFDDGDEEKKNESTYENHYHKDFEEADKLFFKDFYTKKHNALKSGGTKTVNKDFGLENRSKRNSNESSQRKLVSQFYDSLGGDDWLCKNGWKDEDIPICEWYGIECYSLCSYEAFLDDTCPVVGIWLYFNNLHGDIKGVSLILEAFPFLAFADFSWNAIYGVLPDLHLPNFSYLGLYMNQLMGTIPDFQGIPQIDSLDLTGNNLEGTIPNFSGIPLVTTLQIGSSDKIKGTLPNFSGISIVQSLCICNTDIHGTIPDFNHISNVKYLSLSNNRLSGTITYFNHISNVQYINLSNNRLSGTISDMDNFLDVQYIILSDNLLEGTIPDFGNIPTACILNLSNNQLNGTLPNFNNIPYIGGVYLFGNILYGTIPDFDNITHAFLINLSNNLFDGYIPNFGSLPEIYQLDVSSNSLTGTVPSFDVLTKLQILYLRNNNFTGIAELNMASLLILSIENNSMTGTFPTFYGCSSLIKIIASRNKFTKIQAIYANLFQSLDLSNNWLTGSLPDLDNELLTELDLSFNNLTEPLPPWHLLKKLKRLDLYGNEALVGPLPIGMSAFVEMSMLSILKTRMQAADVSIHLLPDVLSFSNTYQIEKTNDNYQCPLITNSNVGHSMIEVNSSYYNRIKCKCLPGYFGFGDNCHQCPRECECLDGITLENCFASPSIMNVRSIIPCPRPESCKSSIPEKAFNSNSSIQMVKLCEEGYEDHGCSKCQDGYGSQGRSCVECLATTLYPTLILSSLGFCLFTIYLYRSETSKSAKIRIIMFHMQTLSIISSGLIQSDGANKFINIISSIGSIQFPNLSCTLAVNNMMDSILFSFARIPVFIIAGSIFYFFGSYHLRNKAVFITLFLLFFIYYSVAREVFGVFGCTVYDSGEDAWFLNFAPWVRCDPASSEYQKLLGLSIPVFLLYLVGLPTFVWRKIRKTVQESGDDMNDRYGFLYLPYKETHELWEFVIIIRRIAFSFITSVIPYTNRTVFFLLLVIVIQVSIWMQKKNRPYNSDIENDMEVSSLYIIFVSFFLALLSSLLGSQTWITILMISLNIAWIAFSILLAFIMPFFKSNKAVNRVEVYAS